jgi:DNA-binding CsgD family transcriptional regulator/catechol 2,3-dioxygenase-like lactoylglutathione lyase family enzyme
MAEKRKRGRPPHDDVLTPAEWRTVHAVQHGISTREIARRRGISVDAVKFHIGNALGKLGLPDRRALRHWFAVPRHSALQQRGRTMDDIQLGTLGQISRTVRDIAESEAWYRDVLRLPHLYTYGRLAFFDCGGVRLMLERTDEVNLTEAVLYFRVSDIQAAYARLGECGVSFTSPPHMIFRHDDGTEEWMAFFTDPEGRALAIMAQVRS